MSSISSPNKRRDTLELTGDQCLATDEQIRRHRPELFEEKFYLDRLSRALEGMKFSSRDALKSHLDEESQQKLEACVTHLTEAIENTISQRPFEFAVHQESDEEEELPVTQNRDFTVVVSNAEAILKSAKQPAGNLEVLHDVSSLINALEKRIAELKESLANPSSREKNSIERSKIEIRVLEDELNDFNEFEKTGKPTAFQRNQKKQLEDSLEKHRSVIRKIQTKARRKKERINFTQETLDQVAALSTEFLAQYDPETSTDFSAELGLGKVLADNYQAHTDHVSAELNRILQTERTGDYTAYYPEVESKQKWDERKLLLGRFRDRFKKWAPRAAVVLALTGVGAYMARTQIQDLFTSQPSFREIPDPNSPEFMRQAIEELGEDEVTRILLERIGELISKNKDDFIDFANRPWLTDEAIDNTLAGDPNNEKVELIVRKLKAVRRLNYLSDEQSDLIFYSNSLEELERNLDLIKNSKMIEDIPAAKKEILAHPFVKAVRKKIHPEAPLTFGYDFKDGIHNQRQFDWYFGHVANSFLHHPELDGILKEVFYKLTHFVVKHDPEKNEVTIGMHPDALSGLKKAFGENVGVKMFVDEKHAEGKKRLFTKPFPEESIRVDIFHAKSWYEPNTTGSFEITMPLLEEGGGRYAIQFGFGMPLSKMKTGSGRSIAEEIMSFDVPDIDRLKADLRRDKSEFSQLKLTLLERLEGTSDRFWDESIHKIIVAKDRKHLWKTIQDYGLAGFMVEKLVMENTGEHSDHFKLVGTYDQEGAVDTNADEAQKIISGLGSDLYMTKVVPSQQSQEIAKLIFGEDAFVWGQWFYDGKVIGGKKENLPIEEQSACNNPSTIFAIAVSWKDPETNKESIIYHPEWAPRAYESICPDTKQESRKEAMEKIDGDIIHF